MYRRPLFALLAIALALVIASSAIAYSGPTKQPGLNPKTGYYCTHPEDPHAVLGDLAQQYSTPYEQVLDWFCHGRFGVGEIKLAFETSAALNGQYSAEEILAMKIEMGGWGRVWQHLGLRGNNNGNRGAKNN
ncbi:MAG: hypothetical protein ACRDFQ_03165 [Anaerolineales bacterium]